MSVEKNIHEKPALTQRQNTQEKIRDFIKNSNDISTKERLTIQQELKNKDTREIFGLIITMFTWFSVAAVSDIILKSISGSAAIVQNTLNWTHIVPSAVFNVGNSTLKYAYLRKKFSHLLTRKQSFLSAIPMIGLPLMIGILFKETPMFAKALKLYAKQKNPLRRFTRSVSNGIKNVLESTRQPSPVSANN